MDGHQEIQPQPATAQLHHKKIDVQESKHKKPPPQNATTRIQPTTIRCPGGGGGKDELAADDIWALQSKTKNTVETDQQSTEYPRKKPTLERQSGEEDLVGSNAGREEEGKGRRKEEAKACGGGGGADKGAMARGKGGSTSNGCVLTFECEEIGDDMGLCSNDRIQSKLK